MRTTTSTQKRIRRSTLWKTKGVLGDMFICDECCQRCGSGNITCEIAKIETDKEGRTKVVHYHKCLSCKDSWEWTEFYDRPREQIESEIKPCVPHIHLARFAPIGPLSLDYVYPYFEFPLGRHRCGIFTVVIPNPSNEEQLKDSLARFDESVRSFRRESLSQWHRLIKRPAKKKN